jgi:hypothetical protein
MSNYIGHCFILFLYSVTLLRKFWREFCEMQQTKGDLQYKYTVYANVDN